MANEYGSFFNMDDSRSVADEDFDEEEVWSVVVQKDRREMSPRFRKNRDVLPSTTARPLPTAARMIPRSMASEDKSNNSSSRSRVFQQSAPVNIPDWSKIYRNVENQGSSFRGSWIDDGEGGDNVEDDDDDKIPPHELIAKKLARSQINAFSVCEGAGRTLKGRDLSKETSDCLQLSGSAFWSSIAA